MTVMMRGNEGETLTLTEESGEVGYEDYGYGVLQHLAADIDYAVIPRGLFVCEGEH